MKRLFLIEDPKPVGFKIPERILGMIGPPLRPELVKEASQLRFYFSEFYPPIFASLQPRQSEE